MKSDLEQPRSLTEVLLALLALPDTRSKEDIVRRYDHEVQGATIVKPFVGRANAGPSDAAVLDLRFRTGSDQPSAISDQPLAISYPPSAISYQPSAIRHPPSAIRYQPPYAGVALAVGINPAYGVIDPYAMAWAAVDEAVRNCVAVGADPDRISLLDNFCWGNPNLPDRLGSLVRCAQGCHDAAVAYGAPFISGKDSLNNEYTGADGVKHAIPGTLLISAVGIVPDVGCTVTTGLQADGDLLYVLGITGDELGGSAYHRLMADTCTCAGAHTSPRSEAEWERRCKCDPFVVRASARWLPGLTGGIVPQPPAHALAIYRALHSAMRRGLVRACHDCSEGGLGVAAAEMVLGGGLGLELKLAAVPRAPGFDRTDALLFGESLGRLLVEVEPGHAAEFETLLAGLPCAPIGNVTADGRLRVLGPAGEAVVEADCAALDAAWRGHLR